MIAAAFHAPGGPEVLELIEIDEPKAEPGQVRVPVGVAGVQPTDLAVREDWNLAGVAPSFPRVVGNEFGAVVDQVSPDVAGFTAGDAVLGFWTLNLQRGVPPGARRPGRPEAGENAVGERGQRVDGGHGREELGAGVGDVRLVPSTAGAVGTVAVQIAHRAGVTVTTPPAGSTTTTCAT